MSKAQRRGESDRSESVRAASTPYTPQAPRNCTHPVKLEDEKGDPVCGVCGQSLIHGEAA